MGKVHLYNVDYVSSQSISGGSYIGNWNGNLIGQPFIKSGNQYWAGYLSGQTGMYKLSHGTDVSISNPKSGQILQFGANTSSPTWRNVMPPLTFSIANIRMSAQQNINLTRFTCPPGTCAYVWQACACNSGNNSVADLKIEFLSGSTVKYSTSSNIVQQGYPLVSSNGQIEIRFAYSGSNATDIVYGTSFMQVSIY